MKKFIFPILLMCLCCLNLSAQVEFSKFKLSKDEPFGHFPGRKMLNTKFKVTADKDLKYVLVDYYVVNAVGDVISGLTKGIISDDQEFVKPKRMECTGPFKAGKSFSPWVSGVLTYPRKDIVAFPYQIQIMYMGTDEWVIIPITKDNLAQYFPKMEWMEVNRKNKKVL